MIILMTVFYGTVELFRVILTGVSKKTFREAVIAAAGTEHIG